MHYSKYRTTVYSAVLWETQTDRQTEGRKARSEGERPDVEERQTDGRKEGRKGGSERLRERPLVGERARELEGEREQFGLVLTHRSNTGRRENTVLQ